MKELKIENKTNKPVNIIHLSAELQNHPSIREALFAMSEGVRDVSDLIIKTEDEIIELKKKIKISNTIGIPTKGLKSKLTRTINKLTDFKQMVLAYSSGYLEIPRIDTGWYLNDSDGDFYYGLESNPPLRVYEALAEAHKLGIFRRFRVIQKSAYNDPLIVAEIGDRDFYITSWR